MTSKKQAKAKAQEVHERWSLYNIDAVELAATIPSNSVHFIVFSPPFSSLYIYTPEEADMGNVASDEEFFEHFEFLIPSLYRITVPGRLLSFHCKDLPRYFGRDGSTGLKDFPGQLIAALEKHGWIFHSRVTIWKCPVTERERTNNNGLLHKTLLRDRSQLRQGMADYLIVMRKVAGKLMSDEPVASEHGLTEFIGDQNADPRALVQKHPSPFARKTLASNNSINIWRRYAEPVWWDIDQMDVLNYEMAKQGKDEKHICPLQLGVIRRAIQLWTNESDIVFSPFAGIGSEGCVALEMGRRFVGAELKAEYYEQALGNIARSEREKSAELNFEPEASLV